jgi:hypothetical protein
LFAEDGLFGVKDCRVGELPLSQNDPTDHALAAIASIFEKPESRPADHQDQPDEQVETQTARPPAESGVSDVEGYTKFGPGPLDALRFKWTARRGDNGYYYVDETIGQSSQPVSSGPMQRDEVVRFIDQREREARRRFDKLRNEMISGPSERGYEDNERGNDDQLD